MPYEFTVIGEHRNDEYQLLVLGTDGHFYDYDPAREGFSRIEPDENWNIFPDVDEAIGDLRTQVSTGTLLQRP
jgi:6-phosphogluconolactonase/glucosamine-6-phosphate isomerase/deaminase